jgi:hypothetical protein
MYGLRKISKDGTNPYNDFVWPLEVGAEVIAPDWDTEPYCGGGLHCLPNAKGAWCLLKGYYWAILKFNKKDMVQIGEYKCKVRKCKIVFLSENPEGMLKFFDINKFDSETAFYWAEKIGDRDIMIDRVTESKDAYRWAYNIGNRDIMIERITDYYGALNWAYYIGDAKIMVGKFPELKKYFFLD